MALPYSGKQYGTVRGGTRTTPRLSEYLGALAYGLPELKSAQEEKEYQEKLYQQSQAEFDAQLGIQQKQIEIQQQAIDDYKALAEQGLDVERELEEAYQGLADAYTDLQNSLDRGIEQEIISEDEASNLWGNIIGGAGTVTSGILAGLKIREALKGGETAISSQIGMEAPPPYNTAGLIKGAQEAAVVPKKGADMLRNTSVTPKATPIEASTPAGTSMVPGYEPFTVGGTPAVTAGTLSGVESPAFALGEVGPSVSGGGGATLAGGGATLGTTLGAVGAFYGAASLIGKLYRGLHGESDPYVTEKQRLNQEAIDTAARELLTTGVMPENVPLYEKTGETNIKVVGTQDPTQIQYVADKLAQEEMELRALGSGTIGLDWKLPKTGISTSKIAALRL